MTVVISTYRSLILINVCLLLSLLYGNYSTAQQFDSATQNVVFEQAKQEFDAFEREHGHFIQTSNGRMHYLTWGDSSGVPLVWSHGSFSNGYELRHVANGLVATGYYVIAIDYYGHGQTPIPQLEVSLYHIADDIKYLMNSLNIDRAIIGGWSRGGYISTAFYDTYPESTLGLILEDGGSVAGNYHYHALEPDSLYELVASFEIEKYRQADTTYSSELAAFFSLYNENDTTNQFHLFSYIEEVSPEDWAVNPGLFELFHHGSTEEVMRLVLRPGSVPLFAASPALIEPRIIFRNLDVPLLILDPIDHNDLFPFETANQALQKNHPNLIKHVIYEDTGHDIHAERPDKFVKDLIDFLARVKRYHNL